MKKLFVSVFVCVFLGVGMNFAMVQTNAEINVPTMINYQGFLTDQNGTALSGSYQLTFSIYEEASGVDPWVWQETHTAVAVENGLFNILLGSIDTLTAGDLTGERFLGITVAGEVEMTPRMRLASVAFSLRAGEANNAGTLDNMDSEDFVAAAGDSMSGTLTLTGGDINTDGKIQEHGDALLPQGFIGMWSGVIDSIPAGWALCDGGTYDRSDGQGTIQTPNLTDRFVVAAGNSYNAGNMGGLSSVTLTINQIPSHTHDMVYSGYDDNNHSGNFDGPADSDNQTQRPHTTRARGGGQSHENRPPYFALAFIMKL